MMGRNNHAVVIAGGGPTGMMLAAELALADVDAVIVEPRDTWVGVGRRSGGLQARTIEVLDQRGIADRFLSAGYTAQVQRFADVTAELDDVPTRHPYGLALWQPEFERILGAWVDELGVEVLRGASVTGLAQDDDGVDVELSDGRTLRAGWVVGCDGGRSHVRRAVGIDFPGLDPTTSFLIGEFEVGEEPPFGLHHDDVGLHAFSPVDGGRVGIMLTERELRRSREPTLEEVRDGLLASFDTDYGLVRATYLSRFNDGARQAAAYRDGRVLLAGDAAHVHPPHGGQGLNVGVQDAVNLGWKLAQVVHGTSPAALLDSYHDERHPVGARAMRLVHSHVALGTPDARHRALRETLTEVLEADEARQRVAAMVSGLDVAYDLGGDHPLVGRRMPDLDLVTAEGDRRVFELLHDARPVLLHLGELGPLDATPWSPRVHTVEAHVDGPVELPVLGVVPTPRAVLIRPDGHVAWVGDPTDPGLPEAVARWFGVSGG